MPTRPATSPARFTWTCSPAGASTPGGRLSSTTSSRACAPPAPSGSSNIIFEEPEGAGGAHARLLVVDDNRPPGVDAPAGEQVHVNRAGDVAGRVGIGGPEIEKERRRRRRVRNELRQLAGRDQQLRICV